MSASIPLILAALLAVTTSAQPTQEASSEFRPFKAIISAISQKPLVKQVEYILRLSKGLMTEDYAVFTRQKDCPHFGHLAHELFSQSKSDLMHTMLKGHELEPYNFFTLAELLAAKQDPETLEILLVHSSLTTPPPKGDEGTKSPEGLVAGEGIPDYSALSLRHYLARDESRTRVQSHLIKILREHKRTGVRAFAAEALGDSKGDEVIRALEAATKDKGYVPCVQCGEDYVSDYAKRALEKIKKAQ